MDDIIWIEMRLTKEIHALQLAEHGGIEGIRDEGLLDSALARPKNLLTYSEQRPDISQLAAAYAFGIARNHPFLDGNKRTAAVVCETFLNLNGFDLTANDASMTRVFLELAEGSLSEQQLLNWLRQHEAKRD